MKTKVLVLFGGVSSEYEVSLVSAKSVISNMPKDKYDVVMMGITRDGLFRLYKGSPDLLPGDKWLADAGNLEPAVISCDRGHHGIIHLPSGEIERIDVVFPVLHGKNGEDGTMQGLLEISGIPYVGCNTVSSAVCMDKAITNAMLDFNSVSQAKWTALNIYDYEENGRDLLEKAVGYLGFPIFVKPANAGSSVGISRACSFEELEEACRKAFEHDSKIVLEEEIRGAEVECAVMGNEKPVASTVGEIVPCNDFYDYDAKYLANESELHIPARLSPEKIDEIRKNAIRVYRALGCSGMTRVDMFVRTSDGKVFLNEVNTIPGFTSISMYPKMFEASGVPYSELLDRLVCLALERR